MNNWSKIIDSPISEGGKAELVALDKEMAYRGENYSYTRYCYRDQDTGLEFSTEDMDFASLNGVYEQYRERHNIPSPEQLKLLRESYGLSATKMSNILGLGVNQYSRYEDGVMPTEAIGKMLRSIETPSVFLEYVRDSKNQFAPKEYEQICAKLQRSFLSFIKSKPDLSWFGALFSPRSFIGKVAL